MITEIWKKRISCNEGMHKQGGNNLSSFGLINLTRGPFYIQGICPGCEAAAVLNKGELGGRLQCKVKEAKLREKIPHYLIYWFIRSQER